MSITLINRAPKYSIDAASLLSVSVALKAQLHHDLVTEIFNVTEPFKVTKP